MFHPGSEARATQPCHSTNMDVHYLLNSLNHAKNALFHQEMLRKFCYPDTATVFQMEMSRQNRLYEMMSYDIDGMNFQKNFLLNEGMSIIDNTKAEEATTNPSLTPKIEVDAEDAYILRNNCKEEEEYFATEKFEEGSSSQQTKRRFWLPAEDAKLIELVSLHGEKWSKIATLMQGRTGKQIRDRYINSLKPGIRQEAWTKEEDELLVKLYFKIGNKWSKIAHFLKGRTENQVKNRFRTFFKRGSLNFQTDGEEEHYSKPKKYIKKEPCACHHKESNYPRYNTEMHISYMQARNNAIWNEYISNSKHLQELLLTKQEEYY